MRDRRPRHSRRGQSAAPLRRAAPARHRRRGPSPDLVEDVLGDLGWRRLGAWTKRWRTLIRAACLLAALAVTGSIAIEAADRFAGRVEPGSIDEALRRVGAWPTEWQEDGWTGWTGERRPDLPEPRREPHPLEGLVAAAPWSPV